MYRTLARLYKATDKYALSKLPYRPQRYLKGSVLWLAKLVVRRRLRGLHVDAFMFSAPVKGSQWKRPKLPEWVREEMRGLADGIDPMMHPDSAQSQMIEFHAVPYANERPGAVYMQLRRQVQGPVDTVLVVSSLQGEGAEPVLHFANALQHAMRRRVLVVATEPQGPAHEKRLVDGCQLLSAGNALSVCSTGEREVILTRLLLQLAPRTVHIIDSLLGWQVVRRFGKAVRYASRVYASLERLSPATDIDRYARQFLAECAPNLDGVIVHNDRNYREWAQELAIPESLFSVVPYPASTISGDSQERIESQRFIQALERVPRYLE